MKKRKTTTERRRLLNAALAMLAVATGLTACEDDISGIGDSLSRGEVTINVDSTAYNLHGITVEAPYIDSRSTSTLLGNISVPEYGTLQCSFVTQLLPAEQLNLSDDIKSSDVDSVRLILSVSRKSITGDSLAPQQLKVYRLKDALPAVPTNAYDPSGKYYTSPLGSRNYSLTTLALSDTAFRQPSYLAVSVPLPRQMGVDAVERYRTDPSLFQWPAEFAKVFPGLYVKPTFGKGCVAGIDNGSVFIYTHHTEQQSVTVGDKSEIKDVVVRDSTCLFSTAPEVISNNIISYRPSDLLQQLKAKGNALITTPTGMQTRITFPVKEVLRDYWKKQSRLDVINNISLRIPAKKINNDYGIGMPPTLLMVKTSEAEAFFEKSMTPDNVTSFLLNYDSDSGNYFIASLRQYIVDMAAKGENGIETADTEFTLIPVSAVSETVTNNDGSTSEQVSSCVPYIKTPTMVCLATDKAIIVFTYSSQTID